MITGEFFHMLSHLGDDKTEISAHSHGHSFLYPASNLAHNKTLHFDEGESQHKTQQIISQQISDKKFDYVPSGFCKLNNGITLNRIHFSYLFTQPKLFAEILLPPPKLIGTFLPTLFKFI